MPPLSGDAVVIANNAPNAPREFISTFGLTQPGSSVSLVVVVKTTTGNEKASAPCPISFVEITV
ncbi:MAG: hypothetical protein FJ386_04280 [Verrucomicrobia bacterium]|nr:hypothetical protein [Verrucomicrobiota bacterium]